MALSVEMIYILSGIGFWVFFCLEIFLPCVSGVSHPYMLPKCDQMTILDSFGNIKPDVLIYIEKFFL